MHQNTPWDMLALLFSHAGRAPMNQPPKPAGCAPGHDVTAPGHPRGPDPSDSVRTVRICISNHGTAAVKPYCRGRTTVFNSAFNMDTLFVKDFPVRYSMYCTACS